MAQCSAALRRFASRKLCALLVPLALAAVGCARRDAVPSAAPPAPSAPAGTECLDFFLLAAAPSRTLYIEIDRVEGLRGPSAPALDALREVLGESTGKRIELAADGVVPRSEWEAGSRVPADLAGRAAAWIDADPGLRRGRETLYVLYAPESDGPPLHGWFANAPVRSADGRRLSVPAIFLFEEAIRREAALWIGPEKIERRALVHELGHALGLVCNPEHAAEADPAHCAIAGCAMQPPRDGIRLRDSIAALGGRVPWRLCEDCRADLRAARRRFAAEARDPSRLRERIRRREAGELFGPGSVPGARISPGGE